MRNSCLEVGGENREIEQWGIPVGNAKHVVARWCHSYTF